jgi:RNA-directed DNA polymerase
MEAVAASGSTREPPLLVRYADNFVLIHPDIHVLQEAIRRVRRWLAALGLQLNAQKTHLTHTQTSFQGVAAGFDFLGFHLRQEPYEQASREQKKAPPMMQVKTIVTPSQDASKRHQVALEQRLQQLHTASQAQVIAELNPLIMGWAAYYNGIVAATTMSHYDDLLEQRLLAWASKRHPDKAHGWLLARYWQRAGNHRSIFAAVDGVQLRAYQHTSILLEARGGEHTGLTRRQEKGKP